MSVQGGLYGKMFLAAFNKEIDWIDDAIKATLHNGYVPDQDAHDYFNDVTNQLGTGSGYTAGGVTLGSKTLTYTAATNKVMLDAGDAVWPAATLTADCCVVRDAQTGVAATEPLIAFQLSSVGVSSGGGDYEVVFNAAGICEVTVAVPA